MIHFYNRSLQHSRLHFQRFLKIYLAISLPFRLAVIITKDVFRFFVFQQHFFRIGYIYCFHKLFYRNHLTESALILNVKQCLKLIAWHQASFIEQIVLLPWILFHPSGDRRLQVFQISQIIDSVVIYWISTHYLEQVPCYWVD